MLDSYNEGSIAEPVCFLVLGWYTSAIRHSIEDCLQLGVGTTRHTVPDCDECLRILLLFIKGLRGLALGIFRVSQSFLVSVY